MTHFFPSHSVSTAIGLTELGLASMALSGYLTYRFGERLICLVGLVLYGTSSILLWLSTYYMAFHSRHPGLIWAYYLISGKLQISYNDFRKNTKAMKSTVRHDSKGFASSSCIDVIAEVLRYNFSLCCPYIK